MNKNIISKEIIINKIYTIKNQKVMLDKDLAELYEVKTGNLNKSVKRNIERFPSDFMFQLNEQEYKNLRFQIGISKRDGRRYLPYVFTEQGVAMLSSVLNSKRAIDVNIEIMRIFMKLRKMIIKHKDLLKKVEKMEQKYDEQFQIVFKTLKQLLLEDEKQKNKIGF